MGAASRARMLLMPPFSTWLVDPFKPGWLYRLAEENEKECEKIPRWQKDMVRRVLKHDDGGE